METLYPLKFKTIFKEKLWGGQKIKNVLGKDYGSLDNCGETWELSGVAGNISEVANGSFAGSLLTDLIARHGANLVGEAIIDQFGQEFPLLIKFIDAAQDLSIQVHPNDELAKKRHGGMGKSEMWYVLQADDGATLINGFSKNSNREEYLRALSASSLMKLLNEESVQAGDVFYLPAGRVHTIGKGLLIAEIQQTSDLTYRIYDFDRVDKNGEKRELHTEWALDAIDFSEAKEVKSRYSTEKNQRNSIVQTPFFTTNKLQLNKPYIANHEKLDSFKIYICLEGEGSIGSTPFHLGEVLLVPAALKSYTIEPDGEASLLETYVEVY